jgi:uncharacterized protein YecT (DUF1311 family)
MVGAEGCAEHRILRIEAVVDRALATLWKQAGSSESRTHLMAAESAWQNYRDAQCVAESDAYDGGTLAPVAAATCSLRFTRQRGVELRRQIRLAVGG